VCVGVGLVELGGNEEARQMAGLLAEMTVSQSGFVRIL
jgi:hypothetical protein